MKWIQKISVLFLAFLYLMSATGIVVYQAHCLCTGDEHISLYVSPGTCEDTYHIHHVHLQSGEEVPASAIDCHECTSHTKGCGCDNVSISFLKLKNEVVFEKVRAKMFYPVAAILPDMAVSLLSAASDDSDETEIQYIEPPSAQTSLDFLIPINQLKIPHKA